MIGEKIYEVDLNMTETVEYGISLQSIVSGELQVPLHGARFDAGFEGSISGKLNGRISGADFAFVRPDGKVELNIHARIDLESGQRIAFWGTGLGLFRPDEPVIDLTENVRLTTGHADYDWVNGRQIWARGTVDLAAGKIAVAAYMP